MPTYVYRCRQCGHEFENNERINDSPMKTCPHYEGSEPICGGEVYRVIQQVGVSYNASGFHCTDYNKTGRKGASYKDYADG